MQPSIKPMPTGLNDRLPRSPTALAHNDRQPPLITLAIFLLALYLCAQTRWQVAGGLMRWSDELLSAACLAAMLIWQYRHHGRTPVPIFLLWVFAVYALSGIFHIATSSTLLGILDTTSLLYAMVIFPLLIGWLSGNHPATRTWLLAAWLVGATVSALVADLGKHGMSFFGIYHDTLAARGRTYGLAFHPNSIGYISSLTAPIAVYFALTTKRLIPLLMSVIAFIALQYAVYGSGSRTSLVAGIVGLAPFAFYIFRGEINRLHIAGLFTVLALVVLAAGSLAYQRASNSDQTTALSRLVGTKSSINADNNRLARLRLTLEQAAERPVAGQGYRSITFAHNLFLQNLHAGGIVAVFGLLLFIGGFVYIWVATLQYQQRHPPSNGEQVLLWTIASSCLIWFLSSMTHNHITDRNAYIMFGILLGLWLQYQRQSTKPA